MIHFWSGLFSDRRLLWFTIGWFVLNIFQSVFTELAHDEAYYWVYARWLDIGYYDHPPMIAVMIRAGGWLFSGEIGVRLLTVLLSTISIPLMYDLCGRKNFNLFALMFCACTVFQVYGFIAVPDSPLLFFCILFFIAYREYSNNDSWANVVLVALSIACLLYSKYHGLLIVFFTVLADLRLLKRKSFYVVIACTMLFYLPHILWQVNHDYPSYQYHVLNKSQTPYNPADTLEFFIATIFVAGPLTGIALLIAFWKHRRKAAELRAMKFTFWGFIVFFFLSTFNSRIEANWMAASVIPLFVVAHDYLSAAEQLKKWTMRLAITSVVIFAFFRVNLMTDIVPAAGSKAMPEFYGWNEWAQLVKQHADGCPVVIMNSYQRASKYSFYTNSDGLSLNNMAYRPNQYDIWPIADGMQGKRVALFRNWDEWSDSLESFETPRGKMMVAFIDTFRCYNKYHIKLDKDWYTFPHSSDVEISLEFLDEDPTDVKGHNAAYPVSLVYWRYYFSESDGEFFVENLDPDSLNSGTQKVIRIRTPDKPGPYYLRFGFKSGWMPPYLNSRLVRMDVE